MLCWRNTHQVLPIRDQSTSLETLERPWDKTFKLAYNILRSDGDIFHAHYLLQDCYLASRFGKRPLVGHAHGSDLRVSLKHTFWGESYVIV